MTDRRAVLQALGAVGAGVGNNAFVHALAALPLMQLIVLRAGGALVVLLPVLVLRGMRLPTRFSLVRAAIEAVGSILLIKALALTSLGFVATISLLIPLGVVFFASILMNERLTRRGYLLVLTGFVGAMIATATQFDTNTPGALAALGAAGCYVTRDLLTRHRGAGESALEMSAMASVMTLALALALAGKGIVNWPQLDAGQAGKVAGMVGLYVVSNLLIVMATRGGRAGLVAATRYSSVLWAMSIDFVVFGLEPSQSTFLGAAIITSSGLVLLRHERLPPTS
jgi:drug/metabolite transporter (DMT)-like permease